jgi:hypothetical protein
MERCRVEEPELEEVGGNPRHSSACWLSHDVAERAGIRALVVDDSVAS